MHQDPFPDPDEDDGQEPDGFPPPDAETGPEQGLFLSLPAAQFDPDQFAQSGPSPDLPPGGMTATLMDMVSGPDGRVRRIVEPKDATPAELAIKACYAGMLCADKDRLFGWLSPA